MKFPVAVTIVFLYCSIMIFVSCCQVKVERRKASTVEVGEDTLSTITLGGTLSGEDKIIVSDEKPEEKPKPKKANADKPAAHTVGMYEVSERVCVLRKWSATIISVRWSESVENLQVYTVEYLDKNDELQQAEFYATEFTAGECSTF